LAAEYLGVILPVVCNANVSREEKIKHPVFYLRTKNLSSLFANNADTSSQKTSDMEKEAKQFSEGFKNVREQLLQLAQVLQDFSTDIGQQISDEIRRVTNDIEDLSKKLEE
jgi:septal ring factor EnvC (AmiA/AmiB activator)